MTSRMKFWSVVAVTGALSAATPAVASPRHHHHRAAVAPDPISAPPRPAFSFYPENVEGGSPGNLPFNNQIRKLTDPLNANGAGG